jgi:chromosome partitioning protein
MIQTYDNSPIQAQQQFIYQTKRLEIPVFDSYIVANNTIFADAPQNGVPVILNSYSNASHRANVYHLENFVHEFISKIGL